MRWERLQVSEALMINSTLFKLMIDIPITLTLNLKELLRGKGSMNQLEKHILPRIINNDPDLTVLKLEIDYLNEDAKTRLLDALPHNSTITSLDLSSLSIGDRGVAQLCDVLNDNFSITSINLKCNIISHVGATSLAAALERNSTLTALNLCANHFSIEGSLRLRNALIWNQTLTYLNLGFFNAQLLNEFFFVSAKDNWIVRKNQSLYDLLFQYLT